MEKTRKQTNQFGGKSLNEMYRGDGRNACTPQLLTNPGDLGLVLQKR
jgi:hypothetical protein